MEKYLGEVAHGTRNPNMCYFIGESGIGKKTWLNECVSKLKFKQIHVNTLYNKNHHYYPKKNLISEIENIVFSRNIETFFTNIRDVVILHNMHTIIDKIFFDSFLKKFKNNKCLCTQIICIIDTGKISERFLDYIIKKCDTFQMNPKSEATLVEIFKKNAIEMKIKYPNDFDSIVRESNGNFHFMETQLLQHTSTSMYHSSSDSIKIDKHIIENNFKFLCDKNVNLNYKLDLVRAQQSLFRLLIVRHVINGLDIDQSKTFDIKLDISIDCIQKICDADKITHPKNSTHIYMQQIIFPTTIIENPSIKGICLSNQHNENVISDSFKPFEKKEFLYIMMILKHCVLNSIEVDINSWIPNLTPGNFVEIQKHFKIFDEPIPKRMFNEFRNKNISKPSMY